MYKFGLLAAGTIATLAPCLVQAQVGMEMVGTSCFFYTPVQGAQGLYSRWELLDSGATAMRSLREVEIRAIRASDGSQASCLGTWNNLNAPGAYQNGIRWSKTAGGYAEIQIEIAPGEVLGLLDYRATNGGIANVTIDGDRDAANLLPGDGEGNRYLDFYSASGSAPNVFCRARRVIPISDELLPGTHTVRLTVAGRKQPNSSDVRVLLDGLAIYRKEATEDDTIAGDFCVLGSNPIISSGAWESVFKIGGTFYGTNQHGYETTRAAMLIVDGIPCAPQANQFYVGDSVHATVDTEISADEVTPIAANHRTYRFSSDGLDMDLRTTWLTSLPIETAYQAMFPILDGPNTSGYLTFIGLKRLDMSRSLLDLGLDLGYLRGGLDATGVGIFNLQHARRFSMEVSDLDRNAQDTKFFVWDLPAPSYNKVYFQRQAAGYMPQPGEQWQATVKYRCSYDRTRIAGY